MHSVGLPRRTQALHGDCRSQRSLQRFKHAGSKHSRPNSLTHLRPLQKVQLSMGFSRLLLWDVDCAITCVVVGLRHGAEWRDC